MYQRKPRMIYKFKLVRGYLKVESDVSKDGLLPLKNGHDESKEVFTLMTPDTYKKFCKYFTKYIT